MKKRILIVTLIALAGILFLSTANPNPNRHSHRIYEERIEVEAWMTKPFVETIEEPLELEDWMTKPFTIN
jgi:hypothetical protein